MEQQSQCQQQQQVSDFSQSAGIKRSLELENDGMIPAKKAPEAATFADERYVETYDIPENYQMSCARVQMDPDGTTRDGKRGCTLEGNAEQINAAKQLINQVIARYNNNNTMNKQMHVPSSADITIEMMIPAERCGWVIGRAGDNIKLLQEQSGCRMNIVQASQSITGQPKPLRITGTPDAVETAKALVNNILTNTNMMNTISNSRPTSHYASGDQAKGEVIVPRDSAGLIIGKGGDVIRRLAQETGTKIQFKPDENPDSAERCAVIMGTREQIYAATERITEIVNRSLGGGGTNQEKFYMHVPADKCGLVIGKGGETIKQINAESYAHCELARDKETKNDERVFEIRGNPQQIHHAQHLIRIKVGDIPPNTPVPPMSGGSGNMVQQQMQQPQQQQYQSFMTQQQPQPNMYNPYTTSMPQQPQQFMQPVQQQPQMWGAIQQQQTPQISQVAFQQQPIVQPQQIAADRTAPIMNPNTGAPDYSLQWAAYYRSIGLVEQAAMVENRLKLNAQPAQLPTNSIPQQQQQQPTGFTQNQAQ
ncbi:unnamed protein product [Caenorhabditis angaria]|uniref:K Homology domain-containing protein n=1 Tax=Caenorhabditis angaria TaxID=860376 RepID=A0A9P1IGJ9_9PELO|nr:unnamed protein product [Caenorhabditis angaria]